MNRMTVKQGVIALTTLSIFPVAGVVTTFADTSASSSFTTQYQANQSKEASLLANITASSALSSSSTAESMLTAVQGINTQVQALYGEEQTLASISLPQPVKPTPQQTSVVQKLASLFAQMKSEQQKHHGRVDRDAVNRWKQYEQRLQQLQKRADDDDARAQLRPDKNLASLQNTILSLQKTAINYTETIIDLLKVPAQVQVSSNTAIAASNGTYVTSVASNQVTVANGTTSAQLTASIKSADGSTQSYVVTDANGSTYNGSLSTGDKLKVTAANGSATAWYTVVVAAAPLSSDVQIETVANTPYVTQIIGQAVKVAANTTASELTSTIHSTDGSAQNYVITDGQNNAVTGTLTTGDVLKVTAANGSNAALYVIVVG